MSTRWNILPDPRFAELQGALQERVAAIANSIQPENFASLLDPLARGVIQLGFDEAGAHEGTIWLPDSDGKHLVPAYNTGPDAEKIVGKFRQPFKRIEGTYRTNSGLICMVFASEHPIVENEVYKNARQSNLLDEALKVQTYALIAVPFHFLKACRGVISCVQLKRLGEEDRDLPGFHFTQLTAIHRTAALLAQLIELRVLGSAVGWSS